MHIKIALLAGLAITSLSPQAAKSQEYVQGHIKQDGTYVPGYYRSSPNSTTADNYSTRGNVNPYTGQRGAQDPYAQQNAYKPPSGNAQQPNPYSQPANPYDPPQRPSYGTQSSYGSGSDDAWNQSSYGH